MAMKHFIPFLFLGFISETQPRWKRLLPRVENRGPQPAEPESLLEHHLMLSGPEMALAVPKIVVVFIVAILLDRFLISGPWL